MIIRTSSPPCATDRKSIAPAHARRQYDLISTYSTRNLGDAAIMRAIASLVPGGTANFGLDGQSELHLPGLAFAQKCIRGTRISVGGDIFNNSRPRFLTRSFLSKLLDLGQAPQRTIAFGQTIPSSCQGLAFYMLAHVLRRLASVTVRDTESYKILKSAHVQADLSWDVAFVTEPTMASLARASATFAQHDLRPDRTALLSVRPFDAMYPADQAAVERNLAVLCRSLLDRGHQVALLIQSDVARWDEDRTSAARIATTDPRIRIIDCLGDAEDHDRVATLAALLSLANIAVGIRYHTTVLRLAAGRAPFNLFYSRKGADLQRRLSLDGCHISETAGRATIKAIEATALRTFDPEPIRRDIRHRFASALQQAAA